MTIQGLSGRTALADVSNLANQVIILSFYTIFMR